MGRPTTPRRAALLREAATRVAVRPPSARSRAATQLLIATRLRQVGLRPAYCYVQVRAAREIRVGPWSDWKGLP